MRTITMAALAALLLATTANAAPMSSYTTKSTPVGADSVLINDSEAANATRKATLSSIVALSPSITYPGAGVPLSTGSAWGTSYTVGTAANNLVQLNASAQLPAVSAALLTNFPGFLGDIAGLTPTANYLLGVNSAGTDLELKSTLSIDVDLGVQSSTAAGRLGRTAGDQISMGNDDGAATVLFSPTDDTAGNGSTTRTWSADKVYDELAVKAGLIASGTAALGTAQINSGACATAVTVTATGTATTDIIGWGFNSDPTSTTGYQGSANGMLTIIAYPSSGNVNFRVCNNTAVAITPGAVTLNWRVVR